jgi:hypothetical protein
MLGRRVILGILILSLLVPGESLLLITMASTGNNATKTVTVRVPVYVTLKLNQTVENRENLPFLGCIVVNYTTNHYSGYYNVIVGEITCTNFESRGYTINKTFYLQCTVTVKNGSCVCITFNVKVKAYSGVCYLSISCNCKICGKVTVVVHNNNGSISCKYENATSVSGTILLKPEPVIKIIPQFGTVCPCNNSKTGENICVHGVITCNTWIQYFISGFNIIDKILVFATYGECKASSVIFCKGHIVYNPGGQCNNCCVSMKNFNNISEYRNCSCLIRANHQLALLLEKYNDNCAFYTLPCYTINNVEVSGIIPSHLPSNGNGCGDEYNIKVVAHFNSLEYYACAKAVVIALPSWLGELISLGYQILTASNHLSYNFKGKNYNLGVELEASKKDWFGCFILDINFALNAECYFKVFVAAPDENAPGWITGFVVGCFSLVPAEFDVNTIITSTGNINIYGIAGGVCGCFLGRHAMNITVKKLCSCSGNGYVSYPQTGSSTPLSSKNTGIGFLTWHLSYNFGFAFNITGGYNLRSNSLPFYIGKCEFFAPPYSIFFKELTICPFLSVDTTIQIPVLGIDLGFATVGVALKIIMDIGIPRGDTKITFAMPELEDGQFFESIVMTQIGFVVCPGLGAALSLANLACGSLNGQLIINFIYNYYNSKFCGKKPWDIVLCLGARVWVCVNLLMGAIHHSWVLYCGKFYKMHYNPPAAPKFINNMSTTNSPLQYNPKINTELNSSTININI